MISVLYVDDEPVLLEIGKLFLEAGGEFLVTTLSSAKEALILLKTQRYDVIISDYQMPEMDGIAFLKALRTGGKTTPFIIFTGRGREEIVIQALNEGADFYLQKGGEPKSQFAELTHKLKMAVQKHCSDKAVIHFNRLYAVLSGVNTTIVRAKSRDELFTEICRITVEEGKFTMAWIGLVDTTHRILKPAASFGIEDGYLQSIRVSIDDNLLGQSPGGRAVREGSHVICNDILRDPLMAPWYPEIQKRGYHSTGAFPLIIHNTIAGVLQIYAEEENFFSEGEIRLLDEVASDISFALERFEADELRLQTEISLKESEEKLAAVVAGTPIPKFVIDRDHTIIYWNRALEVTTGISAAKMIGTRDQWQAFYQKERPTMADLVLDGKQDRINELYAGKIVDSPFVDGAFDVIDFFPHIGDKGRWLRFMAAPIRNEQGIIIGAVETLIDITTTKQAEEELRQSYETIAAAEEELRSQFDEIVAHEERLRTREEQYRRFIDTSYEGVWSMDRNFLTTFVNQRLADMLGYSREEMIGQSITSFMFPEDFPDNSLRLAHRQKGMSERYERRFVRKEGTTLYGLVSATPLFEKDEFSGSFAMITDITERKRGEEELLASEEKFRSLIQNSSDIIRILDREGRIVYSSPSTFRILGYLPEEQTGHDSQDYIHPEDLPKVRDALDSVFDKRNPGTPTEFRIRKKDGDYIDVESVAVNLIGVSGIDGIVTTTRPIIERKRVEKQLQTTVKEYENLLENMSDVYYRSNEQGILVLASRSWASLLGYPDLSACIGKDIASTFYAEPCMRSLFLEEVYRNGSVTDYEVVLKKNDGTPVTVSTSSYLYFDDAGHILGEEGTFRDITERNRITDTLREAEQRMTDIINFLPDATFAIDRKGTVIAWNHAIEEMTGVQAKDIIGLRDYAYALPFYGKRRPVLIDLIFKEEEEVTKDYSSVNRQGTILTAETGMAHLRGKNLILWGKASPLYNSHGEITGAIESIRDFTEQRMLEDSLKQVNRKLNLLSSITRHDILNNISVCQGYLAIAKRTFTDPKIQEHLVLLESIMGTIHSQIAFTRVYQDLGASVPVWQDISELLRNSVGHHTIPVISDVSNLLVYADPLIEKLFTNLLDNTVRHGHHATEIHVRAEIHDHDVIITWEDNGIGIPPNEKEMIFDRGIGRHTGLGLFLVREILGITGLSIQETGKRGNGARFEIFVPKGLWRFAGEIA